MKSFLRSLFETLLDSDRRNPTGDWGKPAPVPLEWNIEAQTLNGESFGAPIEAFRFLGKASSFGFERAAEKKNKRLKFTESACILEFSFAEEEFTHSEFGLDYFAVMTGPDPQSEPSFKTYSELTVRPAGVTWNDRTTREQLLAFFSEPPFRRDTDEKEDILFFVVNGLEYEFEFNPENGPLKRINIYIEWSGEWQA